MSDSVARLEPTSLWGHFHGMTQVPRPSKHEERISAWVEDIAAKHGFEVVKDSIGNLVLRVPASPGLESAPTVVLQGHLDMVCEKNKDTEHDFMNEPIHTRVDGEWVCAAGTTLGADNGIGVAAALAAATDDTVRHGPLELLFTMDEETGLTGAKNLDASMIRGRTLLNLDSEEDGVIYVGCAGGADVHLDLDATLASPTAGTTAYVLEVGGLRGGHSGLNIDENRGNAVKLLTRTLLAAIADGVPFDLAAIDGGDKHNAIPREAEATVYASDADAARLKATAGRMLDAFRTELAGVDDGLTITLRAADGAPDQVLQSADRDRLLRLLAAIPHGVQAMSNDIPGLVETSNNLAAIKQDAARLSMLTSSRSSIQSAIDGVIGSIQAAGELAGAAVEVQVGYPGWKPNLDSAVLGVVRGVYTDIWKKDPEITAIHAGLECGLLGERVPDMDMVSFGPRIEGAHSPEERVHIESVGRFWTALKAVLEKLAAA